MKKILLISMAVFLLSLLSSCGIYEEQCPGVGQNLEQDSHS
jgi:hypothetical protein